MITVRQQPDGGFALASPSADDPKGNAAPLQPVALPDVPAGKGIRNITFKAGADGRPEVGTVEFFDWPAMPVPRDRIVQALDSEGLLDAFAAELEKYPALARRLHLGAAVMNDDPDLRAALTAAGYDPDDLLPRTRG